MEKRIPYYRKPDDMTVDEWQSGLRRQFAAEQKFRIKNTGGHPVFSDFEVYNPGSGNTYKVSVRDNVESFNFCSCPDFTISALGTCKHIEYVLHYFSKYKKYSRYLEKPYNPPWSSLSVYYGRRREIRLKKAAKAVLPGEWTELFDKNGFLKQGCTGRLESFITAVFKTNPVFRVYPDVYEYITRYKKGEERREISAKLFAEGIDSPVFDGLIRGSLYNYQKEGVRKITESGRILLADEMGLGKTIQAIAAVEILAKHFRVKRVLVICPTSVKFQWKREIERFSGREALVVEGLVHKRKELYRTDSFYKIISYGVCRYDLDLINEIGADLVILDEAQRIKNWKTQTAKTVKKITSEYTIVLTGTPLENRIEELHSIVEYIDRYKLGPLFRFLEKHEVHDSKGGVKGYKNLREINITLGDILLRRTKKEIIDQLPGRVDNNFFVEMTPEQTDEHEAYYDIVCKLVSKWVRLGFLSEEDRQKLLICLNCMRMVCDSTYILDQKTDHGNKSGEIEELVTELLENPDNKIVIFSQWKRMFDLLTGRLDRIGVPWLYLNGDLPAREREKIIEEFRTDPGKKVFLSTDAGGTGVNLQVANILINADIPWNPAVLEQRVGRIYRLGQKKHINVFNFIARETIEHRILYLLDFKKTVFSGVIEDEGEDMVMMESFMDAVRNLTEVNLDETFGQYRQSNAEPDSVNTAESVSVETDTADSKIQTRAHSEKNFEPQDAIPVLQEPDQPVITPGKTNTLKNKLINLLKTIFRF